MYDLVKLCLDDHATDNHFAQCGVQCLEIKDEVQFAYILKEAIKCLYEDLNKVKKGEGRLSRSGNDDKVQGRVVAVGHERGRVVVRGARSRGFGAAGEERRKAGAGLAQVVEGKKEAWRAAHGKKLHAELGRLATRVKISEMRRCWTLVSYALLV